MHIEPFSLTGLIVLAIFLFSMALIALEAIIHMEKFKPALFMTSSLIVIGIAYYFSSDDPERFAPLIEMQKEVSGEIFSLIAFMAFMWMIVEILNERNVFNALNDRLLGFGLGPRGMFWATGGLCALLSPFLNNITTAMIFGKSIINLSRNERYTHIALVNIILGSNSGVWFIGTSTSLMVVLAGKISIGGLLTLIPAALIGWAMSALVLQLFYLQKLDRDSIFKDAEVCQIIKPGGVGLAWASALAILGAVTLNMYLNVSVEYALGIGLSMIGMYSWYLTRRHNIEVPMVDQMQKVEWDTLLFFIGVITGVACLSHVGWLSYISWLFENTNPTFVNVFLGVISGIMDNVPVEAAALFSDPVLSQNQWALNALMVGIGGSLTVVGSAAGIMAMSLDKTYTFGVHLRFWPVLLVNFLGSLAIWYVQFEVLGWGN
jgi:Na+/H+ antiporter NhaD/arsenite permease-like protein